MTSQHKTGTHPFYIGMYIHIFTHIHVHIYIYFSEGMFMYFFRGEGTGRDEVEGRVRGGVKAGG